MKISMMSLALALALGLATVALGACSNGPTLTCEQAVPHMNSLIAAEAPEADREKAKTELAGELDKTVTECKAKNMSQEALKCLMDSKATADFAKCK